jgi:hypothetical protein
MGAGTKWTELLISPNCRQSGPVHLSQPEGRVYDMSVEAVPAGFKVVRTEYGESFFCKLCDRQAVTNCLGPLYRGVSKGRSVVGGVAVHQAFR